MDRLGDDELLFIFDKIQEDYPFEGKRSFFRVSKQFMKVACVRLKWLRSSFPDLLPDILPTSFDMNRFSCFKPLSNTHLKLLAQCPKLQSLDLSREFGFNPCSAYDFDDEGLCAMANGFIQLRGLWLNNRLQVGYAGVVGLTTSCKNLRGLSLEGCVRITDESLKAIGGSGIRGLNLRGCDLVTDLGLEYLKNCLDYYYLNLSGCDRITDNGIVCLKQMVHLTELNLSNCGVHISDAGIVILVSQLSNVKKLDLSWLINVGNASLVAIGNKCLKLEELFMSGCEAITVEGLQGLTGHQTLKKLLLFLCYNFCWEDVESVALTCPRLDYFGLMKIIKTPMPEQNESFFDMEGKNCKIDWDVYTDDLFY